MVCVVIGLLIVGGRRVRHLGYVADDPVFVRFGGVRVMPTARTLSRWLTRFRMTTVHHLQTLNATVVGQVLPRRGLRTWTVDVDWVVVSTGLQVERAFRGFNPHQRKVPSYYPIMAHLAETSHILRVKNRSGNVHDGKAGLPARTGRRPASRCQPRYLRSLRQPQRGSPVLRAWRPAQEIVPGPQEKNRQADRGPHTGTRTWKAVGMP